MILSIGVRFLYLFASVAVYGSAHAQGAGDYKIAQCVNQDDSQLAYNFDVNLQVKEIRSQEGTAFEAKALTIRGSANGSSFSNTVQIKRIGYNYSIEIDPVGNQYIGRSWYRFLVNENDSSSQDLVLSFLDDSASGTLRLNLLAELPGELNFASIECSLSNLDPIVLKLNSGTW